MDFEEHEPAQPLPIWFRVCVQLALVAGIAWGIWRVVQVLRT